MIIKCVWEHNGDDTLLYAPDYPGAFTRGETKSAAEAKMPAEIASYIKWAFRDCRDMLVFPDNQAEICIVQEQNSSLRIADADSDVIFETEKTPLAKEEYMHLKKLALRSAADFFAMYSSIADKCSSSSPRRETFYGKVPQTAQEMYEHTKNVNSYYFAEIDIDADNEGSIYECRKRGFELLEQSADFLSNPVIEGSCGELWSLRKVMRRFIWHDRIHAKAMLRMAVKNFGEHSVDNTFGFVF